MVALGRDALIIQVVHCPYNRMYETFLVRKKYTYLTDIYFQIKSHNQIDIELTKSKLIWLIIVCPPKEI